MSASGSVLKQEDILILLQDVLKNNNLHNVKILLDKGAGKCDGFMSVMTKVTIIDGNNKLHVIIKSAPNADVRQVLPITETYDREIYFYKTIFPALVKFQEDRNVLQPFKNVPKCYLTSTEQFKECIVMENLREHEYDLFNRKLRMDEIHIKLMLEAYAKFHAISFAMQDQDVSLFKNLTSDLSDLFKDCSNDLLDQFVKAVDKTIELYANDAVIQERLKKHQAKILPFFNSFDNIKWKYKSICHGDCWTNNMMFKYQNKKPIDICMLDFQAVRIGSPVMDLSYGIYASASHEVYENLDRYLQFYHEILTKQLKAMGTDTDVYPLSALKEDWKNYSFFGYTMAPIIINILLKEENEQIDFNDMVESGDSFSKVLNTNLANSSTADELLRRLAMHMINNDFI